MTEFEIFKRDVFAARAKRNISWAEAAKLINDKFGLTGTPNSYRKEYEAHYKNEIEFDVYGEDETEQKLHDIRIEKLKLSDERTQNNAYLRRISREETIKEIARDFAERMNKEKVFLNFDPPNYHYSDNYLEGILVLSDWHYGLDVDSYFNKYNPDICKTRLQTLLDKVIEKGVKLGVSKVYVVNLSDLIAGRIHQTIRLQSRIDVITQTMEVSEILAEFMYNLSRHFKIEYYDCLDNHSRIEPIKSESLDLESLTRIIRWFLKERFADSTQININDNNISEDIITFEVLGHKVVATHGHKDRSNKVIDNLTLFTQEHYDLVLSAHEHHFSADEKNNTIRFSSGTLMGSDDYSESLRLTSTPSQLFIVASEENITEYVCRIIVS